MKCTHLLPCTPTAKKILEEKGCRKRSLSHIDNDWYWASSVGIDSITITNLKWWERILYWKWADKSYKR